MSSSGDHEEIKAAVCATHLSFSRYYALQFCQDNLNTLKQLKDGRMREFHKIPIKQIFMNIFDTFWMGHKMELATKI